TRGPVPVPDGLTWNAIFSTRDLLRELPRHYVEHGQPAPLHTFLQIGLSTYACRRDRQPSRRRREQAAAFQRTFLALVRAAARHTGSSFEEVVGDVARRSAKINRFARLTGDGAVWAARKLLRLRLRLPSHRFHELIERFLDDLVLVPERRPAARAAAPEAPDLRRALTRLLAVLESNRHGL